MSDEKMVRPLGDRVIVKRDKGDEKTAGGLYIPEAAQEQMCRGEVIAVGPGRVTSQGVRVEPSVKRGDRVLFSRYAGQERGQRFDRSESDQIILREDDILAVLP